MIAKKGLALGMILALTGGAAFAGGGSQGGAPGGGAQGGAAAAPSGTLPRSETLYYNGILWGTVDHWNPYGQGGTTFAIAGGSFARQLIYETLFLYNMIDGKLYPHIGQSYAWNGDTVTVKLNPNVHFNDGTKLTADDAVYSYAIHKDYQTSSSQFWNYIDTVTKVDNYTFAIKAKASNFNRLRIEESLAGLYITSKAFWDKTLPTIDPQKNDRMAVAKFRNLENPVASGAYKPYVWDETKAVLIRDDNYWGKHSSRFGKLPAPKYIVHNVFKDNAAGDAAFVNNEVDIAQQFISQVWNLSARNNKIATYLPNAPYHLPGQLVTLVFNTKRPGLDDPAVRRAIAMGLDNDLIGENAMSKYSPQMSAVYFGLPTPAEQAMVDMDALKQYQWSGTLAQRRAAANQVLDQAGWVKGADGIRAKGGVKLSYQIETPSGWSDFQAICEIVSSGSKEIGIDIKTYFPTSVMVTTNRENGAFDISLNGYGAGVTSPWGRFLAAMSSTDLPPEGTPNNVGNYGRWINQEVNELIQAIPKETDQAKIKQMFTRLNILYLQNVPVAIATYRPQTFHTVNSTHWTGFPKAGDGTNIPPFLCCDGYGYEGLFKLSPVK
jgi:peptide/nickel transport system substrate-binding protein